MRKFIGCLMIGSMMALFIYTYRSPKIEEDTQKVMDDIGEVLVTNIENNDCEKLKEIEENYNNLLSPEQQKLITNYDEFKEVCVETLIEQINNIDIDNLKVEDADLINDAQNLYDVLDVKFQKKVTNYQTLVDAQEEYDKILEEESEENYSGNDDYTTDYSTESSSDYTSSHTCSASGCYKTGTHEWTGITGQEEWYCTDHYNKMLDLFAGMYADTYGY